MSGPRFDELDGEEEEAPGLVASFARGAKDWVSGGFGDELSGVAGAVGHVAGRSARRLADGDWIPDSMEEVEKELEWVGRAYRGARDDIRFEDTRAQQENPVAFGAPGVVGDLSLAALSGGASVGLRGAVATGAAVEGARGLGRSTAELTDGDVYEYVRALEDAGEGAALGAGGGALGYGAGKMLQAGGRKAAESLDSARESLWKQETQAGLREAAERDGAEIARRGAAREAEQKVAEKLGREQGQAMEMNKAFNKRAAREAERATARPRSAPPGLSEEPGTRTLVGYQGHAGERRAINYDRVQEYRKELARADLPEAQRQRLARYVESHGDAVDNPGAFERRRIEQELRMRYPREMVDRIMSERVGPNGEILSRSAQSGGLPELGELTALQDAGDYAARGDFSRVGGGGSAWKDFADDARTVVDPEMAAVRREPALAPMPQRKPGNRMLDYGGKRAQDFSQAKTAGGGAELAGESEAEALVREAEEAMAARRAASAGAQIGAGTPAPTVNIRIPTENSQATPLPRDTLVDTPTTVDPTPVPAASASPRMPGQLRSPAMERAMAREQGAGGQVLRSGYEGLRSSNNVLGAVFGAAVGVGKASVRDPAVRAKALSALKLAKLQEISPAAFSRAGAAMLRALAAGDADQFAAIEHVQLQTDPEYRSAHRQAEQSLQEISDAELEAELVAAGVL